MPTIEQNRRAWDTDLGWKNADAGDRWSDWWGGPEAQWRFSLRPRIGELLPAPTVLEIAPGFGRWTVFLKELCQRLIVVDLSELCIRTCRSRFANDRHIEYHVNDGRSLAPVMDGSIDFVFSFDSLVHADADVLESYVREVARVLSPDGVAFIHHSNWGAYMRYATVTDLIPTRVLRKALAKARLIEGEGHWRARDMTASRFAQLVSSAGLQCRSQELVNWRIRRLSDCISVFTRPGSRWARSNVVNVNSHFPLEAACVRRIAPTYIRSA